VNAHSSKSSKPGFSDDLSIHDGDKSMPMGELGDEQILDPLANVRERSKFNGGSIVLIAVIVLALAGLWFMRAISRVSASTGGNNEVEVMIEKFFQRQKAAAPKGDGATIGSTDPNVITLLSSTYTERQVPLDQVKSNPFILPGEGVIKDPTTGNVDKDFEKRLQTRKSELVRAQAKLELKTVMLGSEPLASISGKIVRKGDEITIDPENVTFRVTGIGQDSVDLLAEDAEFEITHAITLTIKR
jgi:hypothetical protein